MELTYFWVGITHIPKIWSLHGLHPLGSSSHVPKDFALLFIKNTYICCNEHFHNKKDSEVYCNIRWLLKRHLTKMTTWNYAKKNMSLKFQLESLIYLKRKMNGLLSPFIYILWTFSFINYKPLVLSHMLFF